ncbi:MAG: TAXI family TRAP transporter solute-binding subunit [Pseudanabaenaceae cyanobacterium bins.68]|nr:TAXI family TRAP transporter solute-binding subunit [Pseudanabaenaceae cyanobacterium bins.68]
MPTATFNRPNGFQFFLNLSLPQKIALVVLSIISVHLVGLGGFYLFTRNRVQKLVIGAGLEQGESYIFAQALKQVLAEQQIGIELEVRATGGTSESLKLLEQNQVQLAAAQADIPAGNAARLVAILFPDAFQLVVKENSQIQSFSDLKGKRIALPQKGGQYQSFLQVAEHFGLSAQDFTFVGNTEETATDAFITNGADAVWRVRALRYRPILQLIQRNRARLLPIEQAAAMRLKHPTYEPSLIPMGSYRGMPPIPERDLPTVFVQRTLMVHKGVEDEIIRKLTQVLMESKQELADRLPQGAEDVKPLFSYISRPTDRSGIGTAVHGGAIAYYERDKQSFIQENAEYLGLLLTLTLLGWSWLSEAKNWISGRQKDAADAYISVILELMNDQSTDVDQLLVDLDRVFGRIANDLVNERVSQESFVTFHEAFKTVRETIERKRLSVKQQRKDIAADYIQQAVSLIQAARAGSELYLVLRQLESLLEQVTQELAEDRISQEAYRTFMEAYKTTREALVNLKPRLLGEVQTLLLE